MPQPLVDPLPLQIGRALLTALLRIRFELRLQGRKLGERRIRVRLALAPLRTRAAILTLSVVRLAETLPFLTALVAARPATAILTWRTGSLRTMVLPPFLGRRGARCSLFTGRRAVRNRSGLLSRRPLSTAMLAAMRLAMRALVASFETAGPPYFDQLGLCRPGIRNLGRRRIGRNSLSHNVRLFRDFACSFAVRTLDGGGRPRSGPQVFGFGRLLRLYTCLRGAQFDSRLGNRFRNRSRRVSIRSLDNWTLSSVAPTRLRLRRRVDG